MQVLAEQCRRLGVDIEASSSQSAAPAASGSSTPVGGRGRQGWNLDVSAIHRRIKDEARGAGGRPCPEARPLPPGWEVRPWPTATAGTWRC